MRILLIAALGLLAGPAGAQKAGLAAQARSILGAGQGVYVEAQDGTALLAQAAEIPVHPASVSKVPTTLALLRKLGPDHRFVTTFGATGRIVDGALIGDLLVEAGGDPAFVDEDALLVADRLSEVGVRRVVGNLRVRGTLTFDWQSDEEGAALRRALAGQISPGALAAVRAFELESPHVAPQPVALVPLGLRFEGAGGSGGDAPGAGGVVGSIAPPAGAAERTGAVGQAGAAGRTGPVGAPVRALVIHRSQPLLSLAKSLNDYSNNIFKPLADQAGGAEAVESLARSAVPATMRNEITLGDGAGTDPRNRLSPRVTVQLLRALDEELRLTGHALFDILPVAGIDDGTLRHRLDQPEEAGRVVGKTGTFGDYGASALVGAVSTTDRGTVYFAILNHGVPVPEARRRQDRFVRVLLSHMHTVPWSYQRDVRPAIARAEVLKAP